MTEREIYTALYNFTENGVMTIAPDELAEFAKKKIEAIDHRNEKTRERTAARKAEPDTLTDAITEALNFNDEYQTIADILGKIDVPGATAGKVVARLRQMESLIEKKDIKIKDIDGKSRTVKGYRLLIP